MTNHEILEDTARGLIATAIQLEEEARRLRSYASLLRHPHTRA